MLCTSGSSLQFSSKSSDAGLAELGALVAADRARRGRLAAERGQPLGDLFARAEQQHRAAEADDVAVAQDAQLDVFAVDLGAVGAFQIGDDDLVLIFLDLDVKAADALVVELQRVAFFAADVTGVGNPRTRGRDRRRPGRAR